MRATKYLPALTLLVALPCTAKTVITPQPQEAVQEIVYGIDRKQILPDTPKNTYIYCRLTTAMDAKRDGLDFWAAEKAGLEPCKADAALTSDKKIAKYIHQTIAKYYEGE